MIELTVKTLDSKNHAFSVPDDVSIKRVGTDFLNTAPTF